MDIPKIGRGIFDVFVPGMFVLLNLALVIYLLPFVDTETKNFISTSMFNPAFFIIIAIGIGYLIGVLLRLFRTELPDKWSAAWLRRFNPYARADDNEFKLWAVEEFPYIGWLEKSCERYLSSDALDFYKAIWAPRKQQGQNRQFFNFCKVIINSVDEKAMNEINAAEALSRYIAAMFLSLMCVSPLILLVFIVNLVMGKLLVGLLLIFLAYSLALIIILKYFRFVRIKEVETVFAASFKNKDQFPKS